MTKEYKLNISTDGCVSHIAIFFYSDRCWD